MQRFSLLLIATYLVVSLLAILNRPSIAFSEDPPAIIFCATGSLDSEITFDTTSQRIVIPWADIGADFQPSGSNIEIAHTTSTGTLIGSVNLAVLARQTGANSGEIISSQSTHIEATHDGGAPFYVVQLQNSFNVKMYVLGPGGTNYELFVDQLVIVEEELIGIEAGATINQTTTGFVDTGGWFFRWSDEQDHTFQWKGQSRHDAIIFGGYQYTRIPISVDSNSDVFEADTGPSMPPFIVRAGLEAMTTTVITNLEPIAILAGDVNSDGSVDLLDISPFVDVIVQGAFNYEADVNGDGMVDLQDVGPFVDLLN